MNKALMLCLGPIKSFLSPWLELMAQGMVQCTDDQSRVWYHSAIQAPGFTTRYLDLYALNMCYIYLGKYMPRLGAGCHGIVDPSAHIIMPSRVRIATTRSMLF